MSVFALRIPPSFRFLDSADAKLPLQGKPVEKLNSNVFRNPQGRCVTIPLSHKRFDLLRGVVRIFLGKRPCVATTGSRRPRRSRSEGLRLPFPGRSRAISGVRWESNSACSARLRGCLFSPPSEGGERFSGCACRRKGRKAYGTVCATRSPRGYPVGW